MSTVKSMEWACKHLAAAAAVVYIAVAVAVAADE